MPFIATSTTTINSTLYKTSLMFKKEKCGVSFNRSSLYPEFGEVFSKDISGVIDLISDQPKVMVKLVGSYYHLYHDQLGEFFTQYELTPEAKFIIDITEVADFDVLPEYIKIFFKFLNDKKVDYISIDLRKVKQFNLNNFYYRNTETESLEINNPSVKIRNFAQHFIKDKEAPATKKAFLSRTNFQGRDLSALIKDRLPYSNDNRIDDEEILQEYFKSLGFDVIVPEDFKTFEDQINYFDKVNTIVSTSSSGLTNAAFMRPGSMMFELTTPLISFSSLGNGVTEPESQAQEEIHHFYHMMSVSLGHGYASISNKERSAKKIIESIEANKIIKGMLQSSLL